MQTNKKGKQPMTPEQIKHCNEYYKNLEEDRRIDKILKQHHEESILAQKVMPVILDALGLPDDLFCLFCK
jgi:hypothetical protein